MEPLSLLPLAAPGSLALAAAIAYRDASPRPAVALRATQLASLLSLGVAALAVALLAARGPMVSDLLGAGGLGFAVRLDGLSVVMLGLVASLGAALLRFSRNYLAGDARHATFLAELALTIACVMLLVLSANLVQLTIMWSATSYALHRLLVFYPERRGAVVAGRKKFIVARAGDACLVAASLLLFRDFGTGDIGAVLEQAGMMAKAGEVPITVHAAAMLLVLTAVLKAAQFPFHGWLTEMQETPTPVSALLHAGILNGGTFLVVRLAAVVQLSSPALGALVVIGGFSAMFASVVMITEARVKTTLAYSSAAHMGFMLLLCGIGAYTVAVVHLVAHSFYKAHAFLASGSVVDSAKAGWVPRKAKPGTGATLLGLLAAGAMVWAIGSLLGFAAFANPRNLALAVILTLGLGHLVAQGTSGGLDALVFGKTAFAAAATAASFFLLELGGIVALGKAIPEPGAPSGSTLVLAILVLTTFGAVVLIQERLPSLAATGFFQSAYVHARNGLYANGYFDRLIHAWRLPGARPSRAASKPQPGSARSAAKVTPKTLDEAVSRVTKGFAPVWPLQHFVAVNPFLGLSEQPFAEAAQTVSRVAGARMTMPRSFYAEALASGRITTEHLGEALAEARARGVTGLPANVAHLAAKTASGAAPSKIVPVATVADVASALTGTDWTWIVTERIGAWAATYFDEGHASWPSPWRDRPAFEAWRAEARLDLTPEIFGAHGFRAIVGRLAEGAEPAIAAAVARLGIPEAGLDAYLQRLLYSIGGWSAYARHLVWDRELHGEKCDTLRQVLAVRLAWEATLLEALEREGIAEAWAEARASLVAKTDDVSPDLAFDLVLQAAYEKVWQQGLLDRLAAPKPAKPSAHPDRDRDRPTMQAAFCIDVRSEVYRRALEAADPRGQTIGFAGFFGFAIEYIPLGHERGVAQCPVLLTTAATVAESVTGATDEAARQVAETRLLRRRAKNAWKAFKGGAIACFSFVGPVGLAFAPKLLADSLALSRTVPHPANDNVDAGVALGPSLAPRTAAGRTVGLTHEQRVAMGEGLLRGMSLTSGFARLVLLVGHGSTTVNNPHAAGLDCGACGGHTGEANARVAAMVLNEPAVRASLVERGIVIPEDTVFLGCLHDTTTDEVQVFDRAQVPATHGDDLAKLRATLAEAGAAARRSRAPLLGENADAAANGAIIARSADWAQVRPEWGLAGCAAFIVAPRARTMNLDLEGRSFLHSYDWQADEGFKVLELVMTAPMVVGSWISLQYYASTVDNRVFGCGNKVLHNVVGTVGVLEGNGGDLRVGLPWQSVHDGTRFVHEPLRLNVVIEAPIEAMNAILEKHPGVRALVDNGWLHLYALGAAGAVTHRYAGQLAWEPVASSRLELAAE